MLSINQIEKKLSEIDATTFHKLINIYLNKKYRYITDSIGAKIGEDKPRKGTPDTLIQLNNGKYIFVECSTQKKNLKEKFLVDIDKCLDSKKTGIEITKIDKIILACNSYLPTKDIEELKQKCGGIKCDIYSDSSIATDLYNNYKDIIKDYLDIDIGFILSPNVLKSYYLKNFNKIEFLDKKVKPIENVFINLAIIQEQEEKDRQKEAYKREAILNSYEEIQKPKEPIEIKELLNISKKSLIYGKAGIGKTTLCKYIAYKWAKKELYKEFEYVVYIALRKWEKDKLKDVLLDIYDDDNKELSFDIKSNNLNILFLFDGYDELNSTKKKKLQEEINKYKIENYIITTRPYGYQKSDFNVDESFETIGFTDENVEAYIENFFKNSEKEKSLKEFLQNNINIKHIAYIPLMLEMICSLWEKEEFSNSLTITELYSSVVKDFLEKHSKNRDDETVYEWENREDIKEFLGKIAFYGLTKQTILFDGKFIRNVIGKDKLDFFKTSIVNSGFFKSDLKDKSLLGNDFEFLHLTFQEYFAALYVSKLSKEEQSKIIVDWKFYPHMQVFFAFLGGLIENKEFLLKEIGSEPRELIGNYVDLLYFNIFGEINKNIISKTLKQESLKKLTNMLDKKDFYGVGFDYKYILYKLTNILDNEYFNYLIENNQEEVIKKLSFLPQYHNQVFNLIFDKNLNRHNILEYTTKLDKTLLSKEEIDKIINYIFDFENSNITNYIENALFDILDIKILDSEHIAKIFDYLIQYCADYNSELMHKVKIKFFILNKTQDSFFTQKLIEVLNSYLTKKCFIYDYFYFYCYILEYLIKINYKSQIIIKYINIISHFLEKSNKIRLSYKVCIIFIDFLIKNNNKSLAKQLFKSYLNSKYRKEHFYIKTQNTFFIRKISLDKLKYNIIKLKNLDKEDKKNFNFLKWQIDRILHILYHQFLFEPITLDEQKRVIKILYSINNIEYKRELIPLFFNVKKCDDDIISKVLEINRLKEDYYIMLICSYFNVSEKIQNYIKNIFFNNAIDIEIKINVIKYIKIEKLITVIDINSIQSKIKFKIFDRLLSTDSYDSNILQIYKLFKKILSDNNIKSSYKFIIKKFLVSKSNDISKTIKLLNEEKIENDNFKKNRYKNRRLLPTKNKKYIKRLFDFNNTLDKKVIQRLFEIVEREIVIKFINSGEEYKIFMEQIKKDDNLQNKFSIFDNNIDRIVFNIIEQKNLYYNKCHVLYSEIFTDIIGIMSLFADDFKEDIIRLLKISNCIPAFKDNVIYEIINSNKSNKDEKSKIINILIEKNIILFFDVYQLSDIKKSNVNDIIKEKCFLNYIRDKKLSCYIENNKLCSIENGKKVCINNNNIYYIDNLKNKLEREWRIISYAKSHPNRRR